MANFSNSRWRNQYGRQGYPKMVFFSGKTFFKVTGVTGSVFEVKNSQFLK